MSDFKFAFDSLSPTPNIPSLSTNRTNGVNEVAFFPAGHGEHFVPVDPLLDAFYELFSPTQFRGRQYLARGFLAGADESEA
ncbi:hypothetical protein WN48_00994 [Eufriesea mexicana]|uniref:Uncharacterized protein n=1 Tax=Eufriesea mexicana TaxID=516756 RepID=A0A310SE23_9HYME|nr:hypothetical protein WN48_00994 [Eufriesea mexicana]